MNQRAALFLLLLNSAAAFTPFAARPVSRKLALKAEGEATMSEDEVEEAELRQEAASMAKKLRSNMYNEKGVAYAPWMVNQIDEEAYEAAKIMRKQRKAKSSSAKAEEEGAYFSTDLQADELSGLGLKFRFVDDEVELSWKTGGESNNIGYKIQKRLARSADWLTIASYEDLAPLQSKGAQGGSYFFMDPLTEEGDWIYRVVDVEKGGRTTVLCQALVEVQSKGEKTLNTVATVLFATLLLGAAAAGIIADPMQ